MVTKRTRWLSAISVVLMLISMLSCIFVASAQDVSGAEALLDKLNKYEAKNFTDEANAEISGFKDGVIGVIADFAEADDESYNHPEEGYAATLAAFEEEFEATLVPFIKNQLTAEASPLYSAKDLYEGFTTPEGETFKNYDIATKEDWYGVIKASDNYYDYAFENDKEYTTFAGYTFNFVADIDFENVMMYPAGANPIDYFQGNINGNGHTLSNLNIDFSRFTNLKYYDEEGTEIKSGVAGSECAGGFISRSKGITVENIIFRNVVIHEKMNTGYKDYQGNSLAGDNGYNNAGLFGNPHSAAATYKNIIAEVTFDVPVHKCGSGFLGGAGNGSSFTLQNIYYDVTYKNIIAGNIENINWGFSQHNTQMAMTNCVLVSDSEVATERAVWAVRYKGLSNEPALKNIFSAGAPALAFHDANDMGPDKIAAEYAEKKAYDCATAAEAIYKFNHAQGDLMENERCYFDMDAEGKVTFARGTGNVYAVTLTNGEEVSTLYYPAGATVTITLPVGASLKVDGNVDEDAIFEMPAADVAAEIFYDASGMLAAAVQELTALRNKYAPLEAAYVTDLAPITAWLVDADAALAGAPTIDDLNALIERGNALTVEIKADALIPYSKAAAYTPFATFNTWAIAEKADWDAVIAANADFNGITLKVTNDVDFANAETAPAATFKGTLDGQGYVFKNLNIVGSGSSVGLFASFAGTVKNLGLTGKLTSAGTGSIGSFGGGTCSGTISKCWSSMTLDLTGATATQIGGLVGRGEGALAMDKCYFIGSVVGEPANGAGGLTGYIGNGVGKITNSFVAATGVEGIGRSHYNVYYNDSTKTLKDTFANQTINSYAAGTTPFAFRHNAPHYADALALLAENADYQAFVATYGLDADAYASGEVAYKINAGAGEEYTAIYTNDPVAGTVSFSDGTNGTRKVSLVGAITKDIYVPAGGTFDLKTVNASAAYAVITLDAASTITDGVLTMANEDIEVNVTVDDDSLLAAAKAELQAAYDAKSVYDAQYLNEGEDLTAWLAEARDALVSTEIEISAVQELTAAAAEMTFTLKEDAKVPYSKVDLYGEMNTAGVWAISAKEDWIKLTEDYYGKDCHLTLYVTNDIDFESTNMKPLAYGNAKFFYGKLYGQGYAFKNIKIEMAGGTNQYEGVSLVGALRGEIHDLGLTGEVTNTGTTANGCSTAAFAAGANGGSASLIKNCWSAVTVKGPSDTRGRCLSVFHTRPHAAQVIENCINYGTVQSTSEGDVGASVFYGYGAQVTLKNSLDLGTIVGSGAGVVGAIASHHNGIQNFINTNSYSTNLFWGKTHAFDASGVTATMPDGSAITSAEQVDALFAVASAAEAAWKATNGANGTVFYKLDADKGVVFGTATDRVQKVTFTGLADDVLYLNVGATVTLAEIAENATFEVTTEGLGSAVADGVLTVPNADITINVAELGDEELVQALADLKAAYDVNKLYDGAYINEADALAAWVAAAAEALNAAAPDKAAVLALVAQANEMTLTLKADALLPYTKADVYGAINTAKTWAISAKEDWIKLTEDFFGKRCDLTLYVTNDIDFESTNMKPLSYGSGIVSGATIYGQGYTFKNIKIEMEGGTNQYQGVALIGAMAAGGIYDLGLTGEVTNLSTAGGSARTAAFCAGANAGGASTIKNCWSSVTVKGPSDNRGRWLSVFYATPAANRTLENCINYGTVQTTSTGNAGANVFYGYSAQCIMKNCLDFGMILGSDDGVVGAIASHHNGIQNFINTNSYSVNNFWGKTHAFNAAEVTATMPDGSAIETAEQVDALFAVGSAAEAVWRATNGANGTVFYKLDADKGVVFGTATDRVQKIIITGVAEDVKYLNVGDTLDLAAYADYDIAITEGYESAIVEGVLTVPNADVTITLTEKVAIVLGDAKEDGVINLVDAIAVLRGSVDLDTDVNVANGDVNANGVLDANDAVLIVRFWLNDPAYDGPQLG